MRESDCRFEHGAAPPFPFKEIAGEKPHFITTLPEHGLLALSDYRVMVQQRGKLFNITLGNLDAITVVDEVSLLAMCKDGKSYGYVFKQF